MIASLTSFRFITAFIVFIFHCRIHFGWMSNVKILDKFIIHGAIFMTGFFVLSGFIMAHVYSSTDFTKKDNVFNFYLKRFARIYPTYAVATLFYFMVLHDYSTHQLLRVAVNDLFLMQGFFPSMFHVGINGGTWSLTVEMFCYFLFPFIIILFNKKSLTILFIGLILTIITSFNIRLEQADILYSNPVFRIADFLFGMGFYFLCQKVNVHIKFHFSLHALIVVLLFVTCIILGNDKYQYMLGQFIITPLFGLWIALIYHSKSRLYNNKVLEYLGLISYSFYLWQTITIHIGKKLIQVYPHINISLVTAIALAINIGFSILSYHFIEERFRRFILQKFSYNKIQKLSGTASSYI